MRLTLLPHPDTPCRALTGIDVEVVRTAEGALELHFFVMGKVGSLLIPPSAEPVRSDGLWQHSCFEAFVRSGTGAAYHEFNFSPSTAWAAYRFSDYRTGMHVAARVPPPEVSARQTSKSYVLSATVPLADVPGISDKAVWQLGLSAVIEEISGAKSYWALAHPPGKPDFHHQDCFALQLAPPEAL